MKEMGYPVIYDVTHSLQKPSEAKGISGGDSQYAKPLSLGAVACGVDGLFMEVHPKPKLALSDKHTSLALKELQGLVAKIFKIKEVI
jgi:2-dehydro-3-deoxyphosphooctonate aldolase (KDO 8-P synthase)